MGRERRRKEAEAAQQQQQQVWLKGFRFFFIAIHLREDQK